MFDLKPELAPENGEIGNVREMPAPVRTPRPVTNLARIFGQFAQLQQQLGDSMCALEESVGQQREALATDLPAMKQKINWLIATFYEQSRKDEEMREQVRLLTEANSQWQDTVDQLIELLVQARATVPRLTRPAIPG